MAEAIKKGLESPAWYRWVIVVALCFAGFTAVYSDSVIIPRAAELMQVYSLDVQQFTLIATAGVLIPIVLSVFFGSVADKFGPKIVVAVAFVIAIIGMVSRVFVDSFLPLFLLTLLTTFAGAVENAIAAKLIGAWFPGGSAGRGLGVMTAVSLGASIVGSATGALYPSLAVCFIAPAVVGAVGLVFWLIFVKNQPIGVPPNHSENVWKGLGAALKTKSVWIAGLGLGFYMGGNAIGMKFLPVAYGAGFGIDPATAGIIASVFMVGIFIGNIGVPIVAQKIGSQKILLIVIIALATVISVLNYLAGGAGALVYVTSVVAGTVIGAIQPLLMATPAMDPGIPNDARGAAGGVVSTIMMLGAFTIPSFVIAPIAGENFFVMFICGAVCFAIVLVLSFFMPDLVKIQREQQAKTDANQ